MRTVPRIPDGDKTKLFCTPEEIAQWRRESGGCADYLSLCVRMLPSRGPDAGRAGVSAGREAGGEAGNAADPELNAAAPSFVPSALRGSRGEAPAHRDAATSPGRAAERAAEDRSGVSAPADQGSGVGGSPQVPPSLL